MEPNIKVSIVLSTFNGTYYILEQLDSIRLQTRKANEVIILDDCSNDETPKIISDYIQRHQLADTWKLIENEINQGWKRNFMKGFQLAKGDIIFSSDQDDIWMLDKIEKMVKVLESNEKITLLSCNLQPFYESNTPHNLHKMFIRPYGKGRVEKVNVKLFFTTPIRPGCTYAFRRELLNRALEIWYPEWAHDSVLYTVALMTDGYYILNEPLIQFRRHGHNNSPKNLKNPQNKILVSEDYLKRLNLLTEKSKKWSISNNNINIIKKAIEYYKARINFFSNKHLKGCFSFLRYAKFYPDFRSFLGDYYIKFFC